MNSNYYNPMYTNTPTNQQGMQSVSSLNDEEQSYIENILRLNKGKLGKFICRIQILNNIGIKYLPVLLNNLDEIT